MVNKKMKKRLGIVVAGVLMGSVALLSEESVASVANASQTVKNVSQCKMKANKSKENKGKQKQEKVASEGNFKCGTQVLSVTSAEKSQIDFELSTKMGKYVETVKGTAYQEGLDGKGYAYSKQIGENDENVIWIFFKDKNTIEVKEQYYENGDCKEDYGSVLTGVYERIEE